MLGNKMAQQRSIMGGGAPQETSLANGEGPFGRVGNLYPSTALCNNGDLVGGKRAVGTNTGIVQHGAMGRGAGPFPCQDAL